MNNSTALRDRLWEHIAAIQIIDTHEHIPDEQYSYQNHNSLFSFFDHYVSSDLVSAGMSRASLEAMRNPVSGLSLEQRWALFEPYWPFVRTTAYGRAMTTYMSELYEIDGINAGTYQELCRRIAAAHKPGWYQKVLKQKTGIALSLVTTWPGQSVVVDQEYFRAVPILDHYATVSTRAELEALEKESGLCIQTLPQLMNAQESMLDRFVAQGIVGVKVFLAYRRTLHFEQVEQSTASRVFDRIWLSQSQDLTFDNVKLLQDFMMRRLFGLAADRNLPIQIHTGTLEGNGNYVVNTRPTLLTNVFMEFSDARFDLFHAGYPYTGEFTTLAKTFPNVYADLCWIHALSPLVAGRVLDEWLETIPANKILAVGGDSNYVEGAYTHCNIARKVACDVLAQKVEQHYFTEEEALWLANRILRENAASLFRLFS